MDQHHTIGFVQEGHVSRALCTQGDPALTYFIKGNNKWQRKDIFGYK